MRGGRSSIEGIVGMDRKAMRMARMSKRRSRMSALQSNDVLPAASLTLGHGSAEKKFSKTRMFACSFDEAFDAFALSVVD